MFKSPKRHHSSQGVSRLSADPFVVSAPIARRQFLDFLAVFFGHPEALKSLLWGVLLTPNSFLQSNCQINNIY